MTRRTRADAFEKATSWQSTVIGEMNVACRSHGAPDQRLELLARVPAADVPPLGDVSSSLGHSDAMKR